MGETLVGTTYAGYCEKDGGDEGIRTLDLLSATYTQKPVVIGFQPLTPGTERNNAEESRNFRNLSATMKAVHNHYNPEPAVLRKFQDKKFLSRNPDIRSRRGDSGVVAQIRGNRRTVFFFSAAICDWMTTSGEE